MHTLKTPSFRRSIGVTLGALFCGCSAWEAPLDPSFERSLSNRLRAIQTTRLEAYAQRGPSTIDDKIDMFKQRQPDAPVPLDAANRPQRPAPEKMAMDISTARFTALENNLTLRAAWVDPRIAKTLVSEEKAKFDALITLGVDLSRKDLPALDGDFVTFSSFDKALDKKSAKLTKVEQTKENLDLNVGLDVPLPTGAKVKLRSIWNEQNLYQPAFFDQFVSASKFSISQPLLRDAGVETNTASIRIARLNDKSIEAKTKLTAIRVLAKAEKAYWKLYAATKELEVRRKQYDLAFDNLELVRRRVEEGQTAEIEIIRSEVGIANRLEKLIVAETQWRLAQRELKLLLNMDNVDLDSQTAIEITSEPRLLHYEFDYGQLAAKALEQRMEMLELELKLAADAVKIDFARNQTLPLFLLDFEYGVLDRAGSFGSAFREAWDFDNVEYKFGVRGEIPVTNEKRKSKLRRAILTRSQRMATKQLREMTIRQEVFNTLDVLEQNWRRILAARQNVIVSGINYEIELTQFEEGLRTMREVLEALTSLGEAQLKEIKAIVAYQESQIDLAFATGTLLGYADVDVASIPLGE